MAVAIELNSVIRDEMARAGAGKAADVRKHAGDIDFDSMSPAQRREVQAFLPDSTAAETTITAEATDTAAQQAIVKDSSAMIAEAFAASKSTPQDFLQQVIQTVKNLSQNQQNAATVKRPVQHSTQSTDPQSAGAQSEQGPDATPPQGPNAP